ncbi:MAG: hypothetical protein WKF57_13375 [Nakamurella sp.]
MADDWLPAQAPFEIVRRGFSPEQVVSHLESLEYELRIATANRDATLQRVTELTTQLSAAQAESDSLRHQLDRNTLEPYSVASLSDRMQRLIRLAEEEAAEIRAVAETESAELRERTERETSELVRTTGTELATEAARLEALELDQRRALQQDADLLADERSAFAEERESTRTGMAEEVRTLVSQADEYSRDVRARADERAAVTITEADAHAVKVSEDSRVAAEQLLLEAREAAATLQRTSTAESERVVGEATALAQEVTGNARSEAQQLDERSATRRREVEEDFEITMTARRAEAQKVQADRERASVDLAQARLDEAAERSAQQLAQADQQSRRLVHVATVEANRRVQEADGAVTSLTELRRAITAQLGDLHGHVEHVRSLVASAPDLVLPPEQESSRVTAQSFATDLDRRPTSEIPVVTDGDRSADAAE